MSDRKTWKLIFGGVALLILVGAGVTQAAAAPLGADFNCLAQTAIPYQQCEALVTIYEFTSGVSWHNNTGWLTDPDPCAWHGVACDGGVVVALDLFGNNLRGQLPAEIADLTDLMTLTLNDNPLTGEVPEEITSLNLRLFHFHGTQLCEPADPAFQDWFSLIVYRLSSGIYCSPLSPSSTPNIAMTETMAALPTSALNGPQMTLTALAAAVTDLPPGTPTPTKYYTVPTRTPTPTATEPPLPTDPGDGGGGAVSDQPGGLAALLSRIPRNWYWLISIPVILIVVGLYLEIRERRGERMPAPNLPPQDTGNRFELLDLDDPFAEDDE